MFWTYSSASLITEGRRSAPGGVLIRKTFPLSFALCLAILFLTNVFSLLGCNGFVTHAAYTKPTILCVISQNTMVVSWYSDCIRADHYIFWHTVGLKDYRVHLHATQCIPKNSTEKIHGVNMAPLLFDQCCGSRYRRTFMV